MPISLTPNLQQVTTVGATTTKDTTFSGELISTISGSAWTLTDSVKIGHTPTFTSAGSGTLTSLINLGVNNSIDQSVAVSGSVLIVGNNNSYDSNAFALDTAIFGFRNTVAGDLNVVLGYDNTVGSGGNAQTNVVFGNTNTFGSGADRNNAFGQSITFEAGATDNFILGSGIFKAAVQSSVVIGSAQVDHSQCVMLGIFPGATTVTTSQFEFWFGTSNNKYKFPGILPDSQTLRFGDAGDATISYDGTNLIINPDAVGSGKVSINSAFLLPNVDGSANQVLQTNGSGVTSWATVLLAVGGSNTELQYNNAGVLGGIAGLTYNGTDITHSANKIRHNDNISETFGTSDIWSQYSDGTDLIIERNSGSGVVKLGASSDKNLQVGKIGLGTSAVSSLFWVNFVQSTSSGRGALNFDYTYTGTGPQANILSYPTYSGSNNNPLCYSLQGRCRDDSDHSGTGNYGIESKFGTVATRNLTQGNKNFYGLKVIHSEGVGDGAHTGCNIRQYGLWVDDFTDYVGVTSQIKHGVFSAENVSTKVNRKLGMNATATADATAYFTYTNAAAAIDEYVGGVNVRRTSSTVSTFNVPPENFGISRAAVTALQQFWSN